jgi:hypothetical protein
MNTPKDPAAGNLKSLQACKDPVGQPFLAAAGFQPAPGFGCCYSALWGSRSFFGGCRATRCLGRLLGVAA